MDAFEPKEREPPDPGHRFDPTMAGGLLEVRVPHDRCHLKAWAVSIHTLAIEPWCFSRIFPIPETAGLMITPVLSLFRSYSNNTKTPVFMRVSSVFCRRQMAKIPDVLRVRNSSELVSAPMIRIEGT